MMNCILVLLTGICLFAVSSTAAPVNNAIGSVQVVKQDGALTTYTQTTDSDTARGDALMAAIGEVQLLARTAAANGCSFRGSLAEGSDGNFYGQTAVGGVNDRAGVIFKLSPNGAYAKLHDNSPALGTNGRGGLIVSGGVLYGTMEGGGSSGGGVVFSMNIAGSNYTVLHSFAGSGDGQYPYAKLCLASDGYLYGTTYDGGSGNGVIFKILPDGNGYAVLRSLAMSEGSQPYEGVIEGSDGNLYGTSSTGGSSGRGTVWVIGKDGNGFAVLHTFSGSDGAHPWARVIEASDGNLYGTTVAGGIGFVSTPAEFLPGEGTIFKIARDGTCFTTLHNFDRPEGSRPYGGLLQARNGNIYGVAREGGVVDFGTVFEITPSGIFRSLYTFPSEAAGRYPDAALIQAMDGKLYGTTLQGGPRKSGTLYKISTAGTQKTLYTAPGPDAHCKVLIGPGVYEVPQTIRARANHISIIGAGRDITTIKLAPDPLHSLADSIITTVYYSALPQDRCGISDLTVDCNMQNRAVNSRVGAVALGGDYAAIRRVRSINWGQNNGTEGFALAVGTSGGGYGNTDGLFIHGPAHHQVIEDCIVENPAQTTLIYTSTCFIGGGGSPSDFLAKGSNGYGYGTVIRNCIVRNIVEWPDHPPSVNAYSFSVSKGALLKNCVAENLTFNDAYHGFYHDTLTNIGFRIVGNKFTQCDYPIRMLLRTVSVAKLKDVVIHSNELSGVTTNPNSTAIQIVADNSSVIAGLAVFGNRITDGKNGIEISGNTAVSATGVGVFNNHINVIGKPIVFTNVTVPFVQNNRDNDGVLLGISP